MLLTILRRSCTWNDGKGDLTNEEIKAFDAGKEYENGYDKVNAGLNG